MVGSLGATLSGVTFPVTNMYPLVRDASYLFPCLLYTSYTYFYVLVAVDFFIVFQILPEEYV